MAHHTVNCLLCGEPLRYYDSPQTLPCALCGKPFTADAACEAGHYVCDACHAQAGVRATTETALAADSKNPITIARQMMASPFVHMHGPEHHYLVPAALLAAAKNAGAPLPLPATLEKARQRAAKVPGGICGLWGSCGAGIGVGIFVSVATGATPLAAQAWGLANLATSQCLAEIAKNGGPRCCKRDSFLALTAAVHFAREHLNIPMELPESITCTHFAINAECKGATCLYFPKAGEQATK